MKLNRKLIFLLLLVLVILVIFLATRKKPETPPFFYPEPTPTEAATAISPSTLAKVKDQLPVRNNDFSLIYFEESEQFGVTIFQGPYQEKKKMVLDWFKIQGINDPEKLPILWSASRWVTDFEE